MDSRQDAANKITASGNKTNVKIIRNVTVNGDDYTIKPYEKVVVVINTASYTQNLILPWVGESVGMHLHISIPDFGGGGTINDHDESSPAFSTLTYNGDGDFGHFYNNGLGWSVVKDGIT